MLNKKVGFITLVSSFRTCGYLKRMPRAQPLTLAREFNFQTTSHELYLAFFRALHCSQTEHAHKRLSIPHADTVTVAGRQKFARLQQLFTSASGSHSQLCCYDSYQEKACLATSLSKLITIWSQIHALHAPSLLWIICYQPQKWLPFCSSLFLNLLTDMHYDMHAVYLICCFAIVCSEGN